MSVGAGAEGGGGPGVFYQLGPVTRGPGGWGAQGLANLSGDK